MKQSFEKDIQYYKFCLYGFFKNLRFFEPFFVLFFLEVGLNFLQIGLLYSIRELLINVLEIPSGIFADAMGRKRSLITSFLFYIVSFIVFYFTNSFIYFIVAMIFYALGDVFRTGTHKAMIFDYLSIKNWKSERANYYGHTRSWSQFGSAISSIIAALIIFYTGNYKIIFIFSTIPYIIDLLLISSYPSYLEGKAKKLDFKLIKIKLLKTTKDFIYTFKNIKVLKSVSNLTSISSLHKSTKDYIQPVIQTTALSLPLFIGLQNEQKSALLIGLIYFIIYILTSIASRYSGKLNTKIKSSRKALDITLYSGLVLLVFTGLSFHYSIMLITIPLFIGFYIIENLRNPIGVAYVSNLYKDDVLATALSANSQAKSLLAAIFAPILGLLADKYGIGIALISLGLLVFIISPLFKLSKKANKRIEP